MGESETKPRLLVIDDERGPRESLRILLKNDYQVSCADSVDEGLRLLQLEHPVCIIMDIKMPGKTGIDGLRAIRQVDQNVAILMLTGFGTLETAQEALRLGANDYLKKPFDAAEMQKVIALNVRRTQYRIRKDRTARKLEELNMDLLRDLELKERMADIGQASAEFAHDLRNPLTIVIGYVGLLSQQLGKARDTINTDSAEAFEYLDIIEKNVKRCHELSQTWTHLSKSDPEKMAPLHVSDTVSDIVKGARTLAESRNAVVDCNISSNGSMILGHEVQFFRAISNIVVNAIEALPQQDGRIHIDCARIDDSVEIRIEDNGCGMDQDTAEHLFEAYYSDKKSNKGTGLGMFIAKRVIEDHQGSITVTTEANKGTTFVVRVPVMTEPAIA